MAQTREAYFAGGCFWCTESDFSYTDGVSKVTSGYIGGHVENPTYEQVSGGKTGHAEAIHVEYDPSVITYAQLLKIFWRNIDPTDEGGQFYDRGTQYRTAIFYIDEEQKKLAEESKAAAEKQLGRQVYTQIVPATKFYPAEEYHQDFYKKSPSRYNSYRTGSGKDKKLEKLWGEKK